MMMTDRGVKACGIVLAGVIACWAVGSASASITAVGGTVSTTVQERVDRAPASVSSDRQTLGVDAAEWPLEVTASLTSTDLDGLLVSLGQGFGDFTDPTGLDQPNPEEFGAEVACYSNAESVSYSVQSSAVETRSVVFSAAELGGAAGGTREVESTVFLSGAVVFWSTRPDVNLDEMLAELSVTVTRDNTDPPLFETRLELAGGTGPEVRPVATGPIRLEVIGVDELADEGANAESVAILEQVGENGTLVIVLVPPQEHAYTYDVVTDEVFALTATLEARVRNIPGGTGVAAVVGRPFRNLAEFIGLGLSGLDGEAVQRSLNEATAKREIGLIPAASSTSPQPAWGLCGAFGLEGVALLSLATFLTLAGNRLPKRPDVISRQ